MCVCVIYVWCVICVFVCVCICVVHMGPHVCDMYNVCVCVCMCMMCVYVCDDFVCGCMCMICGMCFCVMCVCVCVCVCVCAMIRGQCLGLRVPRHLGECQDGAQIISALECIYTLEYILSGLLVFTNTKCQNVSR